MANAQLEIKFIPTSRGGRYLCTGGFMYRVNKRKRDETIVWKCTTKDCHITVTTISDILTRPSQNHNHPPVETDIKVRETIETLKEKVKATIRPLPQLFQEEVNSMRGDDFTCANLPTFHMKKDTLYRARKKTFPPLPSHRRDLAIPEQFQTTEGGEQFLAFEDGDEDKILGFATTSNLEMLCQADTFFADGTFYVTPNIFYQLYTIHAITDVGQMFPLVYLLLPDKKEATYARAFELLRTTAAQRGFQLRPQIIQMDFETAARNAAMRVFPEARWKGCFFHFTQCVWRKTQQVGLQIDYSEDSEVKRFVRRCAVLPLVPINDVEDVWLDTIARMPDDRRCTQLADYVTRTWIEGNFSQESWNHFSTDGPRTNNTLEGWHNRVKRLVCKAHPNIYELIQFLKMEQTTTETRYIQYDAGQRRPPKKRKYRNLDDRLDQLKTRLHGNIVSVLDYADAAAHLLSL